MCDWNAKVALLMDRDPISDCIKIEFLSDYSKGQVLVTLRTGYKITWLANKNLMRLLIVLKTSFNY